MSEEEFPDYYALLGITPEASVEQIRRAYLEEVGFYHPDNFHGRAHEIVRRALDMTVKLNKAKELLMDPEKRQHYDELLAEEKAAQHPGHTQSTTADEVQQQLTDKVCDLCGKPMVFTNCRLGRFLACSGYPDCLHTQSVVVRTGVACPRCGGDLLEKRSKKGRRFYGCSKYPQCDFAMPQRPVAQPCSACGGLMVALGTRQARCRNCGRREILREEKVTVTRSNNTLANLLKNL